MSKAKTVFYAIRVITLRLLPIAIFALLLGWGAISLDKHNVREAAGEEYVNYTSFNVQNAREGEDVYFSVCRDHKENYNFTGSLSVYVISVINDKPVQVYATDIKGQITNECDNKVILAKDYKHTPNTYEMTFCVDFIAKYDIKKTVCKKSNRYRIYAQPNDLESRIRALSSELETLRAQKNDAVTNSNIVQNSDLSVPQGMANAPNQGQVGQAPSGGQNQTPPPATTPTPSTPAPTPQTCTINLLGIRLLCR